MSAESLREQIAEVLAGHQYAIVTSPLRPACMCGWEAGVEWSGTEVHDLHVADAVLDVLGEVTVREERAVQHRDGWVAGPGSDLDAMRALVADPLMPGAVAVVRRTVVTARRVGEWEVAE